VKPLCLEESFFDINAIFLSLFIYKYEMRIGLIFSLPHNSFPAIEPSR
jgi:hypothetical protein